MTSPQAQPGVVVALPPVAWQQSVAVHVARLAVCPQAQVHAEAVPSHP